ncbi:DinB family protein [Rubripirellula amarantea]|uniref:DinB family protein n=1 Tax=Rubripirellula amarantea TaxID=2527999 RepID=A0A5C5WWV9_9BACT|nr:DinB family protein [Rubripirellula amarantea]TWT55196.1 DinB family protein [Rubripirellula amarantea]
MQSLIDSLFRYNDWANAKIISLCDGISDQQLDEPRAMGFGSLRATLFHILTADEIWLERWQGIPWRPFPKDPQGISVPEIANALETVSAKRDALIAEHSSDGWSQRIAYEDSTKTAFEHRLLDLLLHVFQHGVHHRAQALNYLRTMGRKVPGGIDYLFYRLAMGPTQQSPKTVEEMTQYGLAVNVSIGDDVAWEPPLIDRLFEYSGWAMNKIFEATSQLDSDALDRPFEMGFGSIRKNLIHMLDAERRWAAMYWVDAAKPLSPTDPSTSVTNLAERWRSNAQSRNAFLADVDQAKSQREIEVNFGGPPIRFKMGESAIQLTMHATHHRAQVINMLRRVGSPCGNIDLLYALAEIT